MNDLVVRNSAEVARVGKQDFVTFYLADQLLGIPVLAVHDVLNPQKLTPIPLAPDWVAGVLNLRGRIVTGVDLRDRLGIAKKDDGVKSMSIVVEHNEEPYSLQIDRVGEVLSLEDTLFQKNPKTLDPAWRSVSKGIYQLDKNLLVILDVDKLLEIEIDKVEAA